MYGRLTLLAIALLASGCIAPSSTKDDTEVSALAHMDVAQSAAKAWNKDATLVSVFALESREEGQPIPADTNPGNGLAPEWIYAYVAPATQTTSDTARAFAVDADGSVHEVADNYGASKYSSEAKPVADLQVDSDRGLSTAAANRTFGDALKGDGLTLAEGVATWEGSTSWYYAAISSGGSAVALVDAQTGELRSVMPFNFNMPIPHMAMKSFAVRGAPPVHLDEKGTLDADKRKVEIPFTWEGSMAKGKLDLGMTRRVPTDTLSWRISMDGDTVQSGTLGRASSASSAKQTYEISLEEPGAYVLTLTYGSTTPMTPVGNLGGMDYKAVLDLASM